MALLLNAGDTVSRSYLYTQPSPLHPSQPQGTGERTGNLWGVPIVQGAVADSGDLVNLNTRVRGEYIPVQSETQYTISCNKAIRTIYAYQNRGKVGAIYVYGGSLQTTTITFTTPANCDSVCVGFMNDPSTAIIIPSDIEFVMLNTGSTPLPYEPYGYKIPISSGGVTTNIYLGSTQTTRQIKKYEFTGNEQWTQSGARPAVCYTPWSAIGGTPYGHFYCDRAVEVEIQWDLAYGKALSDNNLALWIFESAVTATEFKQYLAEQYAAGTPVTVWYVLATEETGIVNEPIRKIGEYADTVSGITIPTIAGANSFDVLTTLKPSEITVNYKGWHPVQSVHEYDSNYTIATMQALTIAQLQTHTISELQGGEWS